MRFHRLREDGVFAAREPARVVNTRALACGLVAFSGKKFFSSLNFCRKKFGNPFTCECLFDVGEKISERY